MKDVHVGPVGFDHLRVGELIEEDPAHPDVDAGGVPVAVRVPYDAVVGVDDPYRLVLRSLEHVQHVPRGLMQVQTQGMIDLCHAIPPFRKVDQ